MAIINIPSVKLFILFRIFDRNRMDLFRNFALFFPLYSPTTRFILNDHNNGKTKIIYLNSHKAQLSLFYYLKCSKLWYVFVEEKRGSESGYFLNPFGIERFTYSLQTFFVIIVRSRRLLLLHCYFCGKQHPNSQVIKWVL